MIMQFLVTSAWANAPAPPAQSPLAPFIMLGGMILIFYFLMWRPQSKRAKEHKRLLEELSKGDEVVINGGLMGKVCRIEDQFVSIEIAQNVEVKVQKTSIASSLPKGTLKAI